MVTGELGYSKLPTANMQFIGEGKELIVLNQYFGQKSENGNKVLRWLELLEKNLGKMCEFRLNQDKDTLEIAETGPIWNKDPFIRIKKNVEVLINNGHTIHLVENNKRPYIL